MTKARMYLSLSFDTVTKLNEMAEDHGTGIPEMVTICVRKVYQAWKTEKRT